VTPSSGPAGFAKQVWIMGFGFAPGATVKIGGVSAGWVGLLSETRLSATTPILPPGTLNEVRVDKPNGSFSIRKNGWLADFLDVPQSHNFHDYVERIFRNGVTAGCGGGMYCPNLAVTRAQMAVFLLKGTHGSGYAPPPATGTVFSDVPAGSFAAAWIEQFFAEGITAGCGGGSYCPGNPVTRGQMAVFLLKAAHGSSYTPPAAVGIFDDVPAGSPLAPWIEQLFAEGISTGCGAGNFCPDAPVTRGQMAVFLAKALGLHWP
jgi:hypothetical protein